ncbi:MAG: ABC transporter ATP-binding protein [Burkholderiales bacterium]
MSAALETRAIRKQFGALTVADGIDFRLERGARHALIGPNGAGKTTFINLLTGGLTPNSGEIFLNGENITHTSQRARIQRGLGRTFQINTLFRGLTALDNVALAVAERRGEAWNPITRASRKREVVDESRAQLAALGLAEDENVRVSDLPYGKQRLVEIAIALGMKPSVLLLDEPAAGVPSAESQRILDVLDSLPTELAILIIEHDMELVFRFARQITVLSRGALLAEGTPAEIASDRRVREVYLGERDV